MFAIISALTITTLLSNALIGMEKEEKSVKEEYELYADHVLEKEDDSPIVDACIMPGLGVVAVAYQNGQVRFKTKADSSSKMVTSLRINRTSLSDILYTPGRSVQNIWYNREKECLYLATNPYIGERDMIKEMVNECGVCVFQTIVPLKLQFGEWIQQSGLNFVDLFIKFFDPEVGFIALQSPIDSCFVIRIVSDRDNELVSQILYPKEKSNQVITDCSYNSKEKLCIMAVAHLSHKNRQPNDSNSYIKLISTDTWEEKWEKPIEAKSLQLDVNGERIFYVSDDEVHVRKASNGYLIAKTKLRLNSNKISSFLCSKDGSTMLGIDKVNNKCVTFDAMNAALIKIDVKQGDEKPKKIVFSPDKQVKMTIESDKIMVYTKCNQNI